MRFFKNTYHHFFPGETQPARECEESWLLNSRSSTAAVVATASQDPFDVAIVTNAPVTKSDENKVVSVTESMRTLIPPDVIVNVVLPLLYNLNTAAGIRDRLNFLRMYGQILSPEKEKAWEKKAAILESMEVVMSHLIENHLNELSQHNLDFRFLRISQIDLNRYLSSTRSREKCIDIADPSTYAALRQALSPDTTIIAPLAVPIVALTLLFLLLKREIIFCDFDDASSYMDMKRFEGSTQQCPPLDEYACSYFQLAICQQQSAYCPSGSFANSAWKAFSENDSLFISCSWSNQLICAIGLGVFSLIALFLLLDKANFFSRRPIPSEIKTHWNNVQAFFKNRENPPFQYSQIVVSKPATIRVVSD